MAKGKTMKKTREIPTDRLVHGGRIYTMDGAGTVAEAMATRGDRILGTGTVAEMRALLAPGAVEEDLGGATVIPGLIDAHVHLLWAGQLMAEVQLFDCRTIQDIVDKVAERVAEVPPGTWVYGRGWDETLLAEGRHPTKHDIDPVSPENPVVIERVFNRLIANSLVLEHIGVNRDTPDFDQGDAYTGYFERDENGDPTGLFRDAAKGLVLNNIPKLTTEELAAAILRANRGFSEYGLTAIEEPNLLDHELMAYKLAMREGELSVRIDFMIPGYGFLTAMGLPELDHDAVDERLKQIPYWSGLGDDMFRLAGLKILPDGGLGDYTAAMFEPYHGDPSTRGAWVIPREDVLKRVRTAHEHDLALDCHVCGDAALEVTVEAIAQVQEEDPRPWLRHRVHHALLPTPRALEVMARHKIPAVISSPFLINRTDGYRETVGEEMTYRIMPARSYLEAGVPLASGADTPTADWNPWEGIYALCTRKALSGWEMDPAERLTPAEALAVYTTGGAFALGREEELGSLEPGKKADFVVLETDPHDLTPDELRRVRPLATMMGGKYVHDRRGA